MKVRKGGGEEIPFVQGKEQWLRFAGAVMNIPHIQGKRNPSKMVGVARGHQRADTLKPYSQKTSQSNHTRTTALSNSMKLSHACGATQDGRVMVERSDRMWSTGEGNGKPLQYSCLKNPMNSMKRQNDRILKEELPRSVGAQYETGDQWRNNSRKNEGMEPKQKQYPAVDVTGDRSKVQCCKEQYCIGTWNVRSMNQGKLEVFKQEMARVNVNILGICKLNGLEWVNLTQMTLISTTVGRNPSEEME